MLGSVGAPEIVNVAGLLVPPPGAETVTLRGPGAAPGLIVNVTLIDGDVTVPRLTVMPSDGSTAIEVAPETKLFPVKVTETALGALPTRPELGDICVSAGVGVV